MLGQIALGRKDFLQPQARYARYMNSDEIFRNNLRRLMEVAPEWRSANSLARASRNRLDQTSVSRWLSGATMPSLVALDVLGSTVRARLPDFKAWMLLWPDLDPHNLPVLIADANERSILQGVRGIVQKQTIPEGSQSESVEPRRPAHKAVPDKGKSKQTS